MESTIQNIRKILVNTINTSKNSTSTNSNDTNTPHNNTILIIIIVLSVLIFILVVVTCILSSYETKITPIILRMTSSMRQERMVELTAQIKSIEAGYETKEDIENQIPLPNVPIEEESIGKNE